MKHCSAWLLAAVIFLAGSAVATPTKPGATVRFENVVLTPRGIATIVGSGVHIGNGFILTAQHVVDDAKSLQFQFDNSTRSHTAEVLWSNYDYDVALVYAPMEDVDNAELSCRVPDILEPVVAIGNMHGLRFFHTRGHVATKPAEISRWKDVFAMTGAIGGGMSGGPVLDSAGRIVGITVAAPADEAPSFGFIVPGATICKLLGRV